MSIAIFPEKSGTFFNFFHELGAVQLGPRLALKLTHKFGVFKHVCLHRRVKIREKFASISNQTKVNGEAVNLSESLSSPQK